MITYQTEHWDAVLPELKPHFPNHWQEIALDHGVIELKPRWDIYHYLAVNGCLHVATVREAGRIVGYHISFVHPHMHYADSLTAQSDVFWLHPSLRKGRVGLRLFQFVESELKARGVQKVYTGCKAHFDLGRLFEYLGYRKTEIIYTKLL